MIQLVSGSFLKYGVSAETMAAHKTIFKKSNQIVTALVSLNQSIPNIGVRQIFQCGGSATSHRDDVKIPQLQ